MKMFPLLLVTLALPTLAHAQVSVEDLDKMPVLGNRFPAIEKRLRDVEQRLAKPQEKLAKTDEELNSAPVLMAILRGDVMLKEGAFAAAGDAYRSALQQTLKRLTVNPQAVADSYVVCYKIFETAEAARAAQKPAIARQLAVEVLAALHFYTETAADWQPSLVMAKLEKVQKFLSELQ